MADYERELNWDDSIENDGPEYSLLPEGEYNFQVVGLERKRYNGGAKLPACPMAELKIQINGPDNTQALVNHRLYLHTRTEGLLCSFFTCIGQRRHGEKLTPNWSRVVGSTGRCKLGTREYNGNTYNEIKSFLEPEEAPQTAPSGWAPGRF